MTKAEQLKEAMKREGNYWARERTAIDTEKLDILYQAAQAHLKLLDGIEGLRKSYSMSDMSQKYNEGYNQALDDVMKLMEE